MTINLGQLPFPFTPLLCSFRTSIITPLQPKTRFNPPNRRLAIIWTNANPIHWRIYAALGGDELNAQYRDLSNSSVLVEVLSDNKVLREMCKQRHWDNIRLYSAQLELVWKYVLNVERCIYNAFYGYFMETSAVCETVHCILFCRAK